MSVTLKASDGATVTVKRGAAKMSKTIEILVDAKDAGEIVVEEALTILKVNGVNLKKAMEFCERTFELPENYDDSVDKDLRIWYKEYFAVNTEALTELMEAAHYLHIQSLLEKGCKKLAKRINNHSPERIRNILKIQSSYSRKEAHELRREIEWALKATWKGGKVYR